jgi:hypothetical protein
MDIAIDHGPGSRTGKLLCTGFFWAATLIMLAWAAYFAIAGLLQIINFGWRQPMFDQYTTYQRYLGLEFPESALQLENGHRPIIPVLIRLVEIELFSANQLLQLSIGTFFAFLVSAVIAICAWREKSLARPIRAAIAAAAFIGIFWLANSRMLMHGNESLNVYLLAFFVLLAALCTYRAASTAASTWMIAAALSCTAATFCFGSGIAAFPAIAVVAWLSRVPNRHIGWLGVGLAISIVLYVWILPSGEGVRSMVGFRPIESISMAARWIGSPWVNAWLGYAEPQLYPWMKPGSQASLAADFLSVSSNSIQHLLGIRLRHAGALVFGLAGYLFVGAMVLGHALRRKHLTCIENLALTLALFGGAVSIIIGVGRIDGLLAQPDQIFAGRYLPWTCMFWLGCFILALLRLRSVTGFAGFVAIVFLMIIPFGLLPTQSAWSVWGEAAYRAGQTSAAAALSGVFDRDRFPDDDSASHEDDKRTLEFFRNRHLAMFGMEQAGSLGRTVEIAPTDKIATVAMGASQSGEDLVDGYLYSHFQGSITSGIKWAEENGVLVAVDDQNRVQGFALPSFVSRGGMAPRLNIPRKRGFDGYIRHYDRSRTYRLALLDVDSGKTQWLTEIPEPSN